MNNEKRSRKTLLIATALMVIALAAVVTVYAAAILGTFQGGPVSVGNISSGTVQYCPINDTNGTWTTTLQVSDSTSPWYTRIQLSGYTGPVTISWQLQEETGPSTWTAVPTATLTTTVSLTGSVQYVYASTDGGIAGNQDWSTYCPDNGTYCLTVTVDSAA